MPLNKLTIFLDLRFTYDFKKQLTYLSKTWGMVNFLKIMESLHIFQIDKAKRCLNYCFYFKLLLQAQISNENFAICFGKTHCLSACAFFI